MIALLHVRDTPLGCPAQYSDAHHACRERALRQLFTLFAGSFVGELQLDRSHSREPSLGGETCKFDISLSSPVKLVGALLLATSTITLTYSLLCNAVFFVAYAGFTHAPAGSDLAAREGSWTSSKELGKGAGSHPVGRRGVADTQAGRTLLSEGSNHEHATSQALTHAQVFSAWQVWLRMVVLRSSLQS